jgi:CubicO group peptidase (beta-lactamase class C family)
MKRPRQSALNPSLCVVIAIFICCQSLFAQLPQSKPELVSVSSSQLALMDAIIEEGIAQQKLPGAVVLVGRKGKVVWQKAYGARALEPAREPMSIDTISTSPA